MTIRMRGSAALCALLFLLSAGCDGERRGPVSGDGEGDSPPWVQQAITEKPGAIKEKTNFKSGSPLKPPPNLRDDIEYNRAQQPLDSRNTEPRVQRIPQEASAPWRFLVPRKGEKAAALSQTDTPVVGGALPPTAVRVPVAPNAQVLAETVPLENIGETAPLPPETVGTAVPYNQIPRAQTLPTVNAEIVSADDVARVSAMRNLTNSISSRAQNNAVYNATQNLNPIAPTQLNPTPAQQMVTAHALAQGAVGTTVDLTLIDADTPRGPISRTEKLYFLSDGLSRGKRLEQYGYKTFVPGQRVEPNVPPDAEFVIGPGDEIRVKSLEGFVLPETAVTVDREGAISIPEVGAVKVAGIKYKDLYEIVRAAVAKAGKQNFRLEVSLGRLHGIRVRVDGFVRTPGIQLLGANGTLMDALIAAGGPTKDGTLRDIVVQRAGQPDTHVDLYGMIASGNFNADVVLLSADRVFVGPLGPTAAVLGPVGSGIYELSGNTTLAALMQFVGRINMFTQLNNVQVERTLGNLRREIQTIDYAKQSATLAIQDGDVVAFSTINTQLNETVAVLGAVVRPGTYPFKDGMKVSDLIKAGGNFLLDASLERALIQRPLGDVGAYDVMVGDRAGSFREEAIWVDLAAVLAGTAEADIPLRRLDTLKIFTHMEAQDFPTVKIIGGVRKPGVYRLTAGMTLSDIVRLAGGPTPDAFPGENKIIRRQRTPDGMRLNVQTYRFRLDDVLHRLADYDLLLENQDQVVINRVQQMQVTVRIGGRVQFPGTHVLPDGSKLSNLLAEAGGLLPDADLRAAVFTRKGIQQIQQARLDDLFTRMDQVFADSRNTVIRSGRNNEGIAAHLAYLGLGQLTANIERFQARGRLVVNLTCDDFLYSAHNITLKDGDELYIPSRENIVIVMGETNYPNAFVWDGRMTVQDYINKAGGFIAGADKKQVYVVMSSGEVYSEANKGLFGGAVGGFRPGPGDTILIPKMPPKRDKLAQATDVALLIRQIAEAGLVGATIPAAAKRNANVAVGLNPSNQTPPDIINNQAPEQFYNDTRLRAPNREDR